MENKFFVHQIKHTNGAFDKGIVVKDTLEAAKQTYYAYLGAYGFGKDANTDFVSCMITEALSMVILAQERWEKLTPQPEPEPAAVETAETPE